MTAVRTSARSFSGGEVTPEFWGNFADAKYQTGLALCRNFVVKPHGPVENRAGFAFVRAVKDSAKRVRLLPFSFASNQTLVIEMGPGWFRFHTMGATVLNVDTSIYEVANTYAEADLFDIHYVQSADIVTLVHPNYPPRELRRYGATNWTLTDVSFVSLLAAPGTVTATATPKATSPGTPTLQSYAVTTVSNNGLDESAPSSASQSADGSTGYNITAISKANPGLFNIDTISFPPAVGDTLFLSGIGGMTQLNNNYYLLNTKTLVLDGEGFPSYYRITLKVVSTPLDTTSFGTYVGGGTVATANTGGKCSNNLFDTGAYNTIAWSAVVGAERYNVYKNYNGLLGYIGQTTNLSFTDDNIAPNLSKTPPVISNPFGSAGNYPGAVAYFEQRRCFGGTINKPANFFATRTGTETNLNYSLPLRSDDSITFRMASRERNTIRHIVPMADLILLTDSAEWRIESAAGALDASQPVSIRPQSYIGAANAQPVVVNSSLIFAAARGGHVRELAYNFNQQGYITGDLSIRAPHLFNAYSIVDMTYAKAPVPIVWFVSSSGKLLGLTYVPEQQIGAWHEHDTDGTFESVVAVAENSEDVLYVVVNRTIGGVAKRYVERQATRQQTTPQAAFFVDSGATATGVGITTVTGLAWLEGKTVAVLADGAVMAPRVVTSGAITLDAPVNTVTVGLPIVADVQTLPIALEGVQGYGQGRPKNVNAAWLRVYQSSGFSTGPSFAKLTDAKTRTTEALGTPTNLIDGEVKVVVSPAYSDGGQLCVRQANPLPCTLVSVSLDVEVGG